MTLGFVRTAVLVLSVLTSLSGCTDEPVSPDPLELTRESNGFYCNMIVVDHPGPKAQVFETGRDRPLWFPSVRDAFAYLMLPGEAQRVLAVYVHDMGRAASWEHPQNDGIWIKAEEALYVLDSKRRGGMGARETIPFKDRTAAEFFTAQNGGRITSYSAIPQDYILGTDGDDFGRKPVPDISSNK